MKFWKENCENAEKLDEICQKFWMLSGGRLPEALFMVFQLDSKSAKVCRVLFAPSGHLPRVTGINYFLTQCSPYSHCQRSVPCALSFRYYSRPRCFAAVWWFLLRGRVLSPEGASQKRFSAFSWFSVWSPKVQKCKSVLNIFIISFSISILFFPQKTHMCKSCRSRGELSNEYLVAKVAFDTAENGPLKVC